MTAPIPSLPGEGALLVDFDGTLLNACSTELYLDCARPAPLAGVLLWLIDGVKPWRILPGSPKAELIWRDWIRVVLITLLFPWTPWLYRRRIRAFAEAWTNRELVVPLRAAGDNRVTVVTHGFRFIVAPLLAAMGPVTGTGGSEPRDWGLVAAPVIGGPAHRRRGKAAATRALLGVDAIATARVLTDTPEDDADLIAQSGEPILVTPPEGWFKRAHASAYRPFAYLEEAKHPGHGHLKRVYIGEDWVVLVLAGALAGPSPLLAALGLLFLILAFFIVYEQGYYENDHRVTPQEPDPFLTEAQRSWQGTMSAPWAWAFALGLSLPGVALLASAHANHASWWPPVLPAPTTSFPTAFLGMIICWVALLVVSRLLFSLFNRTAPRARILLFPFLQAVKGIGVAWAVMLPVVPVGACLLLGQVVSRWLPYAIYRMNGPRWTTPDQTVRLIVTLIGALAVALGSDSEGLFHWSAGLILLWCFWKARREILDMVKN